MNAIISREERPWGTFEVLSVLKEKIDNIEQDVVIKKITVNPGKRLSLQSHVGRAESWFFLAGQGQVTVGDRILECRPDTNVLVPKGMRHRIANTDSSASLVLIETSVGVVDEHDITRYEDDFGRA